jgi:Type IX secretion system membrane protein PorP/SprF
MLKKSILYGIICASIGKMNAQVTTAHTLFQYSMTPFQATALPYNYLDKFDRHRGGINTEKGHREDQKSRGWYLNLSTRHEIHPQIGVISSGVFAADHIENPNKIGLKFGGGVMYSDLGEVQITSPFVHCSVGKDLDENWRLLGGLGYRFATQRLNPTRVTYKDLNDPKIQIALESAQSTYNAVGVSMAIVHIEKLYLGFGMNRILGSGEFAAANGSSFTETNLLLQYIIRSHYNSNWYSGWDPTKGSLKTENPNRGFLTNINLSIAMRYLNVATQYPLHAQINCRTTLTPLLWTGLGWNTANRWQIQFGLLKIPVFKMDSALSEYHIWLAYDLPNYNTPQHGVDLNIGYYF